MQHMQITYRVILRRAVLVSPCVSCSVAAADISESFGPFFLFFRQMVDMKHLYAALFKGNRDSMFFCRVRSCCHEMENQTETQNDDEDDDVLIAGKKYSSVRRARTHNTHISIFPVN